MTNTINLVPVFREGWPVELIDDFGRVYTLTENRIALNVNEATYTTPVRTERFGGGQRWLIVQRLRNGRFVMSQMEHR